MLPWGTNPKGIQILIVTAMHDLQSKSFKAINLIIKSLWSADKTVFFLSDWMFHDLSLIKVSMQNIPVKINPDSSWQFVFAHILSICRSKRFALYVWYSIKLVLLNPHRPANFDTLTPARFQTWDMWQNNRSPGSGNVKLPMQSNLAKEMVRPK